MAVHVPPVEDDPPGRRRLEPGHRPQHARLAAAARPQQGDHLGLGDVEIEPIDGDGVAVADGEAIDREHGSQNSPRSPTRRRSMPRMATAVTAARIVLIAMA